MVETAQAVDWSVFDSLSCLPLSKYFKICCVGRLFFFVFVPLVYIPVCVFP